MHQNFAVILQQLNYGKNGFIALVPEPDLDDEDDHVVVGEKFPVRTHPHDGLRCDVRHRKPTTEWLQCDQMLK